MKRYQIIDHKPIVSESQLDSYQNFDDLMEQAAGNASGSKGNKLLAKMALLGILLISGYFMVSKYVIELEEQSFHSDEKLEVTENGLPDIQSQTAPVPPKREMPNNVQTKDEPENQVSNPATEHIEQNMKSNTRENEVQSHENQEGPKYEYIEAEPVDGITSLYEYFDATLTYPAEALPDSIQGVTLVTFTINLDGGAEDIVIEKSLGPPFDQEAIRLIENMPEWHPASINGQDIRSKISIPLTFRIDQ